MKSILAQNKKKEWCMWMQLRGKQIPAWVLLLVILGAAAAAVAAVTGATSATVLTGDTQMAVADKLMFDAVDVEEFSDYPAVSTGVVHVANDRQSFMVNFIADEGDTVIINMNVTSTAGIPTVVKIMTEASEYFDIGYSIASTFVTKGLGPMGGSSAQLGSILRKIDGEWVLSLDAGSTVKVYQYIWIKTKPPTPPGQYTIMTWIEQKFQQ
jgi:hypothetical protein